MGEVYRTHDPRLGRDVALKVSPSALAGDPARLERFAREARVVAALNHNIIPFLMMVLVGGPYGHVLRASPRWPSFARSIGLPA